MTKRKATPRAEMSEERRKAAQESVKKNLAKFDEIRIRLPKESGLKSEIEAGAKLAGESVNSYVISAIKMRMEQERAGKASAK